MPSNKLPTSLRYYFRTDMFDHSWTRKGTGVTLKKGSTIVMRNSIRAFIRRKGYPNGLCASYGL